MSNQEEFIDNIKEWDRIDDLIRQFETNLKELRAEKKKIQQSIIPVMQIKDIDICNMKDGKIHLKTSRKKVNYLTKKSLPDKLKEYYVKIENIDENISNMKVQAIMDYMDTTCEYTESQTLSKIKSRKLDDN